MLISVHRQPDNPHSIPSSIFLDGIFECYGLEPSRTNPAHSGHPCVPAGAYSAILTRSPHLGYVTPELVGVPGRSEIRIHIGNYPKDSLGCILVGETNPLPDFVGDSRAAFKALMLKLQSANAIRVEILD